MFIIKCVCAFVCAVNACICVHMGVSACVCACVIENNSFFLVEDSDCVYTNKISALKEFISR